MYPRISLGLFSIRTYDVMGLAAIATWVIGLKHRVRQRSKGSASASIYDVIDAVFYVVLGALMGGWLVSVLPSAVAYVQGTSLPPRWWMGGQGWIGLLGGGSLAAYGYCRRRGYAPGKAFDLAAPVVPLGHAVGRIGCLLAGCCYGRETTAWLSLVLPDIHGVWARRYPTRIASIVANLLISILLLSFEHNTVKKWGKPLGWPFDGFLFLLYAELYCVQRFYFEFWRGDRPQLIGPFTWFHLYCAIGIGLATWLIVRGLRTRSRVAD